MYSTFVNQMGLCDEPRLRMEFLGETQEIYLADGECDYDHSCSSSLYSVDASTTFRFLTLLDVMSHWPRYTPCTLELGDDVS